MITSLTSVGQLARFAMICACNGLAFAWCSLAMAPANAAEPALDFANEVFSNVRLIKGENDLVGWRIQIVRSATQTYVLVQSFEGTPQVPCLAKAEIDMAGSVQFDLPPACDLQGRFTGKIQKSALVGGFSNGMKGPDGEAVMTLKRLPAK